MNYNDWLDNAVAISWVFPLYTKEIITDVKLYYISKDGSQKFEKTIKALWDTGAQCSVISRSLEKELNLPLVSTTKITGVSGKAEDSNVYVVDMSFHDGRIIKDLRVAASGEDSRFSMIIGMDIIRVGDFSLGIISQETKSGGELSPSLLFSFAYLSSGHATDYVKTIMSNRKSKGQLPKDAEARKGYLEKLAKSKKNKKRRKH